MMLPPLTADVSLYRSMAHYRSSWPASNSSGIAPSQVLPPDAFQPHALTNRQKCITLLTGICGALATGVAVGVALLDCVPLCVLTGPGFLFCVGFCDELEAAILAAGATAFCAKEASDFCTKKFGPR